MQCQDYMRISSISRALHLMLMSTKYQGSLVVIDVQLRIRISCTGRLESDRDIFLPDDVVEDGLAQTAVFVKDLVDNVLFVIHLVPESRSNQPISFQED